MKKTATLLFATLLPACASFATIAAIDSVTFTTNPGSPITGDTILSTFTSNAITYNNLRVAESVSGYVGTEWLWPINGTNPGSFSAALLDMDINSGTLNTGSATIYHFSNLQVTDTLFYFGNYGGDNPAYVIAVDSMGNDIGTALAISPSLLTTNVATTTVSRSSGSPQLTRTIHGVSFQLSDLAIDEASASDVAGIRFYGTMDFDVNMVGVASIPEASTYALYSGALLAGLVVLRRLRRR